MDTVQDHKQLQAGGYVEQTGVHCKILELYQRMQPQIHHRALTATSDCLSHLVLIFDLDALGTVHIVEGSLPNTLHIAQLG